MKAKLLIFCGPHEKPLKQGLKIFQCFLKKILISKILQSRINRGRRQSGKTETYWYPYTKEKYELFSKIIDTVFQGGLLSILKTALLAMNIESLNKKHPL